LRNLIITIVFVQWPSYARIVRGMTLKVREREFIEAARASGVSRRRIVARHVLPNLLGPIVVLSTLDMGRVLLAVSGLSFLGFGISPPTPEWGAMLADAKTFLDRAPQLLLWPGMSITLMVLAFNLTGDGLRDLLDPRTVESTPGWEGGHGLRRRSRRSAAGAMLPEHGPEGVADLAHGGAETQGVLHRVEQVGGAAGGRAQRLEGGGHGGAVT
jgi:hypothetical protein